MTERLPLDPQTRRWLKREVSRRRREKELHVGRPVLHRYSKQAVSDLDLRQAVPARNPNSQLGAGVGLSQPGIDPRGETADSLAAHAARRAAAAMFEIGKTISYRGRLYVIVGVTPIGATPCLIELEDAKSGRVRSVQCDDPELITDREGSLPTDDQSPEPEL